MKSARSSRTRLWPRWRRPSPSAGRCAPPTIAGAASSQSPATSCRRFVGSFRIVRDPDLRVESSSAVTNPISEAVQALGMRAGIVGNVTQADRDRLDAIVSGRSAPQKQVWRTNIIDCRPKARLGQTREANVGFTPLGRRARRANYGLREVVG